MNAKCNGNNVMTVDLRTLNNILFEEFFNMFKLNLKIVSTLCCCGHKFPVAVKIYQNKLYWTLQY